MDFTGFGSCEIAWACLQKPRGVMVQPGRNKLTGIVEVDETYIEGMEIGKGSQGRSAVTKTLVNRWLDGTHQGKVSPKTSATLPG